MRRTESDSVTIERYRDVKKRANHAGNGDAAEAGTVASVEKVTRWRAVF